MTTIAYRAGLLAADSQATGGGIKDCSIVKLARNERGDLCAAAGDAGFISRFLGWFIGGEKHDVPDRGDGNEGVIIRADGSITGFDKGGDYLVIAPYYAVGSGRQLALGAMAAGATAAQAVEAAIKHDVYSGGPVSTLSHRE